VGADVRELVSLEDVLEETDYGPNGGLVYCFEYLNENLEWLHEQLGDEDDEYYIIDCPVTIPRFRDIINVDSSICPPRSSQPPHQTLQRSSHSSSPSMFFLLPLDSPSTILSLLLLAAPQP
jgi:hypothetical protein